MQTKETTNTYLVPEEEVRKHLKVSASVIRKWRLDGVLIDCYVKIGRRVFYDPEKLREEMLENGKK